MASTAATDIGTSIDALTEATNRLHAAVDLSTGSAGADTFAGPSRLPDWTIGHVVTHLARNADGLRRVLLAAQDGQQITPYDSPEARENDIEIGARRGTTAIANDLVNSNRQLAETIAALDLAEWSATVDLGRGGPTTADVILSARLAEVELHHHDLGVDAGLALLDETQATRLLAALMRSYVRTRGVAGMTLEPLDGNSIPIGGGGQQVSGRAIDLIGWLAGRTDGANLTTSGPLPDLPTW